MIARLVDARRDRSLEIFDRLRAENPEAVDEAMEFIAARHHTAQVVFRFHGGALQCIDANRVLK